MPYRHRGRWREGDAMKLTEKQQSVLDELRKISRKNLYRYRGVIPHLHQGDCEKLAGGDQACVFGLGGLTYQVGYRLGIDAKSVLSTFKALQKKDWCFGRSAFQSTSAHVTGGLLV